VPSGVCEDIYCTESELASIQGATDLIRDHRGVRTASETPLFAVCEQACTVPERLTALHCWNSSRVWRRPWRTMGCYGWLPSRSFEAVR
jgi:hypothetical protein